MHSYNLNGIGKPMLIMLYMSSIYFFIPKGFNIIQIWK
jgi:hypothetical protein